MTKYEEKFVVFNRKRFDELNLAYNKRIKLVKPETKDYLVTVDPTVERLIDAINKFEDGYKIETGKKLNQKYYVCNQDEPYAQKVIDIIIAGENAKGL